MGTMAFFSSSVEKHALTMSRQPSSQTMLTSSAFACWTSQHTTVPDPKIHQDPAAPPKTSCQLKEIWSVEIYRQGSITIGQFWSIYFDRVMTPATWSLRQLYQFSVVLGAEYYLQAPSAWDTWHVFWEKTIRMVVTLLVRAECQCSQHPKYYNLVRL